MIRIMRLKKEKVRSQDEGERFTIQISYYIIDNIYIYNITSGDESPTLALGLELELELEQPRGIFTSTSSPAKVVINNR